jgi:fibronectin type 3 domain-containing protein
MKSWIRVITAAVVCGVMAGCGSDDTVTTPTPITPVVAVPAIPTTVSVEPGDTLNTVQWSAVAGATSYNLYWSDVAPLTKQSATVVNGAVSPYKHTGLTNGKLLYYAVTASNSAGESELSSVIGATPVPPVPVPAAPATVNATSGDTVVTLAWTAVSGAASYNVYWSKASPVVPGSAGVTKIGGLTVLSYSHVGLTNGDRYYYLVSAVNSGGESVASTEVSATPMPASFGAPMNLAATRGDTKVQLSWSPVQSASSYNVYWSKTAGVVPGGSGVTKIDSPLITATSYTHTGLVNGDTYYYVVTAIVMGVESAPSAEKSARPLPPAPPAPATVSAVAAKDALEIAVQWFDVTYPSAVGYNLYRGLQPGVATYLNDPTKVAKFANVTAPFIDTTNLTTATYYYYVVTAFVQGFTDVESAPSGEAAVQSGRSGGGGGGDEGGDEGFGNNLSFPTIFADGYGLSGLKISGTWPGVGPFATLPTFDFNTGLRPLSTETLTTFPFFDSSTAVSIGGITYYPQASASTWQAEWRVNTSPTMEVIVDWGDALLSKSYTAQSMVRIETILKQDATIAGVTDSMTAYKMALLSGSGINELQGTDRSTYASATRNVFAINARLKVEKLAADGSIAGVLYDKAVYEGFGTTVEGGGRTNDTAYAAELNQGGLVVYGKNFYMTQVTGEKTGKYRITFSLDPTAKLGTVDVPNHIKMVNKSDAGAMLSTDGLSTWVEITVN